jgi:hypothetical protein
MTPEEHALRASLRPSALSLNAHTAAVASGLSTLTSGASPAVGATRVATDPTAGEPCVGTAHASARPWRHSLTAISSVVEEGGGGRATRGKQLLARGLPRVARS